MAKKNPPGTRHFTVYDPKSMVVKKDVIVHDLREMAKGILTGAESLEKEKKPAEVIPLKRDRD